MYSKSSSQGVGGGGGTAPGGSGVAEEGGVSTLADSRSSVSGVSGRPKIGIELRIYMQKISTCDEMDGAGMQSYFELLF